MSGTKSPSAANYPFQCRACKQWWCIPHSALLGSCIDGNPISAWCLVQGLPTRCLSCIVVLGAIDALNALVFREPWLETVGVAGAPEKAAWELVGLERNDDFNDNNYNNNKNKNKTQQKKEKEKNDFKVDSGHGSRGSRGGGDYLAHDDDSEYDDNQSSAGDGRTQQESDEFREEMLKSFIDTTGEGFAIDADDDNDDDNSDENTKIKKEEEERSKDKEIDMSNLAIEVTEKAVIQV